MATTFGYQTGKVETDLHFIEWDTRCKGSGLPCLAGSDRCLRCVHYGGFVHPSSFGPEYWTRLQDSYVLCRHPEARDAEGSGTARMLFREMVRREALSAID